jgi:quercetin dioxygenase-like cupin family protein
MKSRTGVWLLVVSCLCLIAFLGGRLAVADSAQSAILWPAADIQWSDSPALPGARIAVLWGDPKTGAYGSLKSIPAGKVLPSHSHTYEQKVVVVSGSIVLGIEGGHAKELGPGSYAFVPGGLKHTATCVAGADCLYFEEQPGRSDVKLADAAPAKK